MPLDNTQMINQSLPIPEHKMGWMIGKGGSYIKQLSLKVSINKLFLLLI